MTVYVFGDSFTELYSDLKNQYIQIIANEFKTNVQGFGLSASSIEYTYYKFNNIRNEIKEKDIIIVGLTSYNRRWFFKYYPGNLVKIYNSGVFEEYKEWLNSPNNNPKEIEALELYSHVLNNKNLQEYYLLNFLYNLNYVTKIKNLYTIVFLNLYDIYMLIKDKLDFPHIRFAKNMMLDISLNELTKEYVSNYDQSIYDLRINHISKSNHLILAEKVIENIKSNQPIDCNVGFEKNFISFESLKDQNFIDKELFGGYLLKLR